MRAPSLRLATVGLGLCLGLALLAAPATAAEPEDLAPRATRLDFDRTVRSAESGGPGGSWSKRRDMPPLRRGFSLFLRGAWVHQFEAKIDDGGRMDVDRLLLRASLSYSPKPGIPITLTLGYRYDGYRWGGPGTFGAAPWGDVHSLRATLPLALPLGKGKRWLILALPTVRTTVEEGADLSDGVTWSVLGGAIYKANDRLSIGPGVGVVGELEDATSVFPILLVEWQITSTLSLKTGEGLGATQGPGLFLEWDPAGCWIFSFGGRYERLRFRLDDHGVAPKGIGQETSFPLVVAARYDFSERFHASATLGVNFFGSVRLEDESGNRITSEDYDPAFFVGFGFGLRF